MLETTSSFVCVRRMVRGPDGKIAQSLPQCNELIHGLSFRQQIRRNRPGPELVLAPRCQVRCQRVEPRDGSACGRLRHPLNLKKRDRSGMLRAAIVSTVTRCTRHAWAVLAVAALAAAASGVYAVRHFAINTDINTLISPDLPWRQREIAFEKAFPQHLQSILVVVEAPTPELDEPGDRELVERLSCQQRAVQDRRATGRAGRSSARTDCCFCPSRRRRRSPANSRRPSR